MIVSSGRVCYYRVEPSGFSTGPFVDTSNNKFRNAASVFWGRRCVAVAEFLFLPERYSSMEALHTLRRRLRLGQRRCERPIVAI
jgi:hypothetical protein